jgi:hypothetical protein
LELKKACGLQIYSKKVDFLRTTFAKAYGIKVGCYGEHVGEHIENLNGT